MRITRLGYWLSVAGLWVFLWLRFAKPRAAEVQATEGVPAEEHDGAVQAQNPDDGLGDRQRDKRAPQDVRRHQPTAQPVFVRPQPPTSETPFRPPETPSPGNRPTADEWFAVASSEEPAGNDEQFEIEPSEEPANNDRQSKRRAKPILIGAGVLTLLAVAAIAAVSTIMTDDSNHLAKCDIWLQEQLLTSQQAAANAENANAVVAAIQDQRAANCSPSVWNPLVTNVSRDHETNIDVRFSTAGGISRGATVTTNAEHAPRWFYMAAENRWYSPAEDTLPILAMQPTSTTPPPPPPTATTRPVHAPRSTQKVPAPPTTPYSTPSPKPTNAVTQGQVQFIEVGGNDSFSGQAATEFEKGKDLLKQENYHAALQAFQAAQVHHGKPSSVLENQIGMAFRRLDDHQQAIDHFTKAIEIKDNPVGRVNRSLSYIETSQCPLTFQDAKRALDMEPKSAEGFSHPRRSSRGTEHLSPNDRRQRQCHRARKSGAFADGRKQLLSRSVGNRPCLSRRRLHLGKTVR